MKATQRKIYYCLAKEIDWCICAFCKYYLSYGSSCDGGESFCTHPLLDRSCEFEKQEENATTLDDCWGFSPRHKIAFCADIVGMVLVNGWSEAMWWQDNKGLWVLRGE